MNFGWKLFFMKISRELRVQIPQHRLILHLRFPVRPGHFGILMEKFTCPASRKNRHGKRHGILYLTMVYNIGMSAIHFTYLSTVVHVQSSMYHQPCIVTHTVTMTVCVTMVPFKVRYSVLPWSATMLRYDGALRWICISVVCYGALQTETRMWANAQPDGRPAEHRWRPLFSAAKFS